MRDCLATDWNKSVIGKRKHKIRFKIYRNYLIISYQLTLKRRNIMKITTSEKKKTEKMNIKINLKLRFVADKETGKSSFSKDICLLFFPILFISNGKTITGSKENMYTYKYK